MRLLFITQKLHGQDAFGVLWIDEFRKQGYEVEALCLEWRQHESEATLGRQIDFIVHSLGKEGQNSKLAQIFQFLRLIASLKYDRVFIHMTPVWGVFGAPVWIARGTPVYLWYTHYKMQLGLKMLGWYGKRLFCATPQSLPQYPSASSGQAAVKKVVVGHGIDLSYWPMRPNAASDSKKLLIVHRLSRSKRVELSVRALQQLPGFSIDIYGIEAEGPYVSELKVLVQSLALEDRVHFHGTISAKDVPALYTRHKLILNMAGETIDKTMLEALTCGCYPVTTKRNAEAIGLPYSLETDTPAAIADFVKTHHVGVPLKPDEMYTIVRKGHSLEALVEKMDHYIRQGK